MCASICESASSRKRWNSPSSNPKPLTTVSCRHLLVHSFPGSLPQICFAAGVKSFDPKHFTSERFCIIYSLSVRRVKAVLPLWCEDFPIHFIVVSQVNMGVQLLFIHECTQSHCVHWCDLILGSVSWPKDSSTSFHPRSTAWLQTESSFFLSNV